MTAFKHQPRSGRKRRKKERGRKSLEIRSLEGLVAHRELAYIRNPTPERLQKLERAKRRLRRTAR